MAKTWHFVAAAVVLALASIGVAFGLGYYAPTWLSTPTEITEIALIGGIFAALLLLFGSLALQGKDGEGRSIRGNGRGVVRAHHVGWFSIAFIVDVIAALAADAWATINLNADPISAGFVGVLVFILVLIVIVVIFAGMTIGGKLKGRRSRAA